MEKVSVYIAVGVLRDETTDELLEVASEIADTEEKAVEALELSCPEHVLVSVLQARKDRTLQKISAVYKKLGWV